MNSRLENAVIEQMLRHQLLTATTSGTRVGEVDLDAAAVELLLVEAADGRLGLTRRGEGDEAEATGAASLTVTHHDRL